MTVITQETGESEEHVLITHAYLLSQFYKAVSATIMRLSTYIYTIIGLEEHVGRQIITMLRV